MVLVKEIVNCYEFVYHISSSLSKDPGLTASCFALEEYAVQGEEPQKPRLRES